MRGKVIATVAMAALSLALLTPGLGADRGVGVTVGEVAVLEPLTGGRQYSLGTIGVVNTGSQTDAYSMSVTAAADLRGHRPGETWFEFQPRDFRLAPGETQTVAVAVNIPGGAPLGDYQTYLRAHTVTAGGEGGASIGTAAATRLTFSVTAASWLEAQRYRVNEWLDRYAIWLMAVSGAMLLVVLVRHAHKLPFRVRVERR